MNELDPNSPDFDVKKWCAHQHSEGLRLLEEKLRKDSEGEFFTALLIGGAMGLFAAVMVIIIHALCH